MAEKSTQERLLKLEAYKEYEEKTLDKIEKQVNKIEEAVTAISTAFNEHNGATAAKGKIHNNMYMWLTFLVLIIGNDVFWNYWHK